MAASNVLLSRTFNLSSDHNNLSSNTTGYFKCVRISDADNQCGQTQTAGARVLGITQGPAKKGKGVSVAIAGISKVRLGNTVTRGDHLSAGADGRAVRYLGTTSKHIFGVALQSAGTGDVIECIINNIGFAPTGTVATL